MNKEELFQIVKIRYVLQTLQSTHYYKSIQLQIIKLNLIPILRKSCNKLLYTFLKKMYLERLLEMRLLYNKKKIVYFKFLYSPEAQDDSI